MPELGEADEGVLPVFDVFEFVEDVTQMRGAVDEITLEVVIEPVGRALETDEEIALAVAIELSWLALEVDGENALEVFVEPAGLVLEGDSEARHQYSSFSRQHHGNTAMPHQRLSSPRSRWS